MASDEVKDALPVEDPAYRDVDDRPWRPGRFEERVRRAWNQVTTEEIRAAGGDLEKLTDAIHARVGGDRAPILHTLERFREAEGHGRPREDLLVRPGAPYP